MHGAELQVPVLVHAADNDQDVFIEENRLLRDAMHAAGKDTAGLYTYREFHNPPGGHSFGIADTPQGRASWRETVDFLARRLADSASAPDPTMVTFMAAASPGQRNGEVADSIADRAGGRYRSWSRTFRASPSSTMRSAAPP